MGSIIFVLALIGAVSYVYWLIAPASENNLLFYCPIGETPIRWAIVLPIVIGVLGIFFVGMWTGWTMAITPPPNIVDESPEDME